MTTDHQQTRKDETMSAWSTDDLRAIAENDDLFVSPLREDGTTYGTPTQTWALIVDSDVYVRAANGPQSRWYQAAMSQRAGRVRVADKNYEVTFEPAGDDVSDAIDAAYEAKYPGSTAVPIMQGDGPKSAIRPNRAPLNTFIQITREQGCTDVSQENLVHHRRRTRPGGQHRAGAAGRRP